MNVDSAWVSKKGVRLALLAHKVLPVKFRFSVGIKGPKNIGASQRVNMSSFSFASGRKQRLEARYA